MKAKSVQFVTAPQETHWVGDGFRVNNFIPALPGLAMTDMDPFILLDYNQPMEVAPTDAPRGVGVHPHRGFETVTLALKGRVEHHDSHGGGGVGQPAGARQDGRAGLSGHHQRPHGALHVGRRTVHGGGRGGRVPRRPRTGYDAFAHAPLPRATRRWRTGGVQLLVGLQHGAAGA